MLRISSSFLFLFFSFIFPSPTTPLSSPSTPIGKPRSWSQEDISRGLHNLTRTELISLLLVATEKSNDIYSLVKNHLTSFGEVNNKPVALQEYDRLGFIRFRKVASTTLSRFLIKSGFCVGECEFQTCLYRHRHCEQHFECETNDPSYPCTHLDPAAIHRNFVKDKARWLTQANVNGTNVSHSVAIQKGQLHLVTVLREPKERILSEFFYCQSAHPSLNWHHIHSEEVHAVVKTNNLTNYIALGNRNPGLNRMTLQLTHEGPADEWLEDVYDVSNKTLATAIQWLRRCRLVLLAEYVPQSLALFRYTFGGADPEGLTFRQLQSQVKRKSHPNSLREQWAADTSLMDSLSKAAWADNILYEEAKSLFFRAFAAMLEAKGEGSDLQAGLAKYNVTERDVQLSWDKMDESNDKPDGFVPLQTGHVDL